MIKDILAVIEAPVEGEPIVRAAVALAESWRAHLEIAVLTPGPVAMPALAPFGALYLPEPALEQNSRLNVEAVKMFTTQTTCPVSVFGLHDDVAWLAGDVRRSRQLADLIMVGPASTWTLAWLRRRVLETMILSAGTPILILPPESRLTRIRRAVIGWKAGAEVNRAVHDLVGMIEPGARVDIVTVCQDAAGDERALAEVKRHLIRHGLMVDINRVTGSALRDSEALQDYALQVGADLLAVGGFAHSRVREVVLGGVTRDLVDDARIPVLLSH